MYQRYHERAAFLFVYIHEAHPADGWQLEANRQEEVVYDQPQTWDARRVVADACCSRLKLSMPCAVDSIDNRVDELYAAWPERMFVIDVNGRVAYAGAQGPFGFKPKDAERALKAVLRNRR